MLAYQSSQKPLLNNRFLPSPRCPAPPSVTLSFCLLESLLWVTVPSYGPGLFLVVVPHGLSSCYYQGVSVSFFLGSGIFLKKQSSARIQEGAVWQTSEVKATRHVCKLLDLVLSVLHNFLLIQMRVGDGRLQGMFENTALQWLGWGP